MCQTQPGPRCHGHSRDQLDALTRRIAVATEKVEAQKAVMQAAALKSDLTAYTKARKEMDKLKSKQESLQADALHVQRDLDGTKTGKRKLEEAYKSAKTAAEIRVLDRRVEFADAKLHLRREAVRMKEAGRPPVLSWGRTAQAA